MKTYVMITGTLRFKTALHIGTGFASSSTDAPLRRDAQGRIRLPGSALAGALRTLATRLAPRLEHAQNKQAHCAALKRSPAPEPCGCAVCQLFGDFYPGTEKDAIPLTFGSRLWVYDAALSKNPGPTRIRDGVGIDRHTGAAAVASAAKFDLELLPAGACFDLRLELRQFGDDDLMLLAAVLGEWRAARGRLGGRTARGFGAFVLEDVVCKDINLADNILDYLKATNLQTHGTPQTNWFDTWLSAARRRLQPICTTISSETENSAQEIVPPDIQQHVARAYADINFDLQFDGPFLIHDAVLAGLANFNHTPMLEALPPLNAGENWQATPVLTGAGLRGVLRSHAEKIARTIASHKAWGEADDTRDDFFRKICPACNPLQADGQAPLANCDTRLRSPQATNDVDNAIPDMWLAEDDEATDAHLCLACRLFGSTRRGSRLLIDDAHSVGQINWKPQDFLAIDRFTGGGMHGAKFNALSLVSPTFRVRMRLENPEPWELGWLAFVLRDAWDAMLTFGFGAAKGYGRAAATNVQVTLSYLHENDARQMLLFHPSDAKSTARLNSLLESGIDDALSLYTMLRGNSATWAERQWVPEQWIAAFRSQIDNFASIATKVPPPQKDSYFGSGLEECYPIMPEANNPSSESTIERKS